MPSILGHVMTGCKANLMGHLQIRCRRPHDLRRTAATGLDGPRFALIFIDYFNGGNVDPEGVFNV
jgi:hypothetical protein